MPRRILCQKSKGQKAQTAIEYLLLLGVVVSLVLIAFKTQMASRIPQATELYFNRASTGIMGKQNPCGDGVCATPWEDGDKCCVDCNPSSCPN